MKKFKITLETVLKYKMIEEFPDAFEKKLEVGKWYKYPGHSLFATYVKEDKRRFGITTSGSWFDDADSVTDINGYVEMTQKEVETALIAEARKRGYDVDCVNLEASFVYGSDYNEIWFDGNRIFNNGIWATIKNK